MSTELVSDLMRAISESHSQSELGAIVLVGEGAGFRAGSDLNGLANMTAADQREFEAESGRLARMIGQCAKPVIAAVHGFAVGGGFTLATSCDVVITQSEARWTLSEVPIGVFPAWGIASIVARSSVPTARRLCWGVDMLDGAEAHRLGLADIVVEENVRENAMELATKLAALPRRQAEAVKRYFAAQCTDEASDLAANRIFMEMAQTTEVQASFLRHNGRNRE